MAKSKDVIADAQTLLEEKLSEKKSVESARRSPPSQTKDYLMELVRGCHQIL